MKVVSWVELGPYDLPQKVSMLWKDVAILMHKTHPDAYTTDDAAVRDFIVVFWATVSEQEHL